MKQLTLLAAVVFFVAACNNGAANKEESKTTDNKTAVAGAYPATYSSSFETGDMNLANAAVLNSWKNWEASKFDGLSDFLADSVTALYADGTTFRGSKDSLIANWKKTRASLSSVVDSIAAYTPVYNTDKKENWALIWVTDYSTNSKGVKDTIAYQETWRFNKDGKADMVLQYQRTRKK